MNENTPILIIGAGSIGERHIRNLWYLGYRNLLVYRQRNLPFRDIDVAEVSVFTSFDEALKNKPEVAFICTPTSQHMQQAIQCISNNMHVFSEKPLSHLNEQFDELSELIRSRNKLLQVAFMMHYHPLIKYVKDVVSDHLYGNLISMKSYWGSYLPDWHPWENYKESYAAKKSMGGGVALTLCHDVELALWIAGSELNIYKTTLQYADELGIESESIADFQLDFRNGIKAAVHLNYLDQPPVRTYHFKFEDAEIDINYFFNQMEIRNVSTGSTSQIDAKQFDRNTLYIDEVKDFFTKIQNLNNPSEYSSQQVELAKLITKICTDARS